jgi:hypothetical protein
VRANFLDFTILDQVAIAGLITGDDALAKVFFLKLQCLQQNCIDRLSAQFPTSPRVYSLMGMQLESQERLTEAAEYYELVLSQDPMNLVQSSNTLSLHLDGMETSSGSSSLNQQTCRSHK